MQTKQSHQEKCGFDQPPGESQKKWQHSYLDEHSKYKQSLLSCAMANSSKTAWKYGSATIAGVITTHLYWLNSFLCASDILSFPTSILKMPKKKMRFIWND